MKFLMAFMFSIIPAAIVALSLYFVLGPFAILIGWAVFGLGMEVCLNGSDKHF